jgi:hypothetical protein
VEPTGTHVTASFVGPQWILTSLHMGKIKLPPRRLLESRVVFKSNGPGAKHAQLGVSLRVAADSVDPRKRSNCKLVQK